MSPARRTLGSVCLVLLAGVSRAVGALAPAPMAAPVPAGAAQSPDTQPEPVLVELRLDHIASRTVPGYRVRSEALVPLTQFLQLAEIRYHLSPDGRLEATVDPGGRRLVIDIREDTMRYGEQRVRIEPEFKLFRAGELYVGAERLGDLLGSPLVTDFTELAVTMADPSELPLARRLRRDAARAVLLRGRETSIRPDRILGFERPGWDGLVFDYSILSPSSDPVAGSGYTAALGADVFGGSLELAGASVGRAADGVVRVDGSWTGVWPTGRWLQQLRLGDATSTGPRSRSLRGVAISNAPYVRPSVIGVAPYGGQLESGGGWSVEAYRGTDLLAFDSVDTSGRFTMPLPVRYGENPVDFVAYGPLGEIREFNQTYRVVSELLPAGRFEYGVSLGSCRSGLCEATGNADVRYGATARWTVQAGLDQFWRDTLPDRSHPYVTLTASPRNSWAVSLDGVVAALAHGGVHYEPSIDLRLTADYTRFADGTVAPLVTVAGQRSRLSLTGFLRPVRRAGFFFFDGAFDRITSASGTTTFVRLGASTQGQALRLLPFVRFERHAATAAPGLTQSFVGVNAFVLPRPTLGPVLGPLWLRGGTEVAVDGMPRLSSYSLFAARPVGSGFRVEAGVTWLRGAPGAVLTLTLTSYLSALRSFTTLTAPAGGTVTGSQLVQGSLLWDRATGRLATAPGPSLERSGISGRIFRDDNGNDLPDPGEPGVPGVRVRVGTASAISDSDGTFRVWDIVPFEPVTVAVDSLSLPSPLLVPAFASARVEPGPNRFRGINIPIVQAGVIEGRVVRPGAEGRRPEGVGGVMLVLTDARTGATRRFSTFTDGGFYAMGVKPGVYELAIDPRTLDALVATAVPLRLTLSVTPGGVAASGLELRLTPKP
jgi:hypothetical protein